MEGFTVELTAYSVLAPVTVRPLLDTVELTVLRYLRGGRCQANVSEILGFDISCVVAELARKQILYPDATFRVKDESEYSAATEKTYKKGFVFRGARQVFLYDRLIFSHEIRFNKDFLLANDLGNDYVSEDILNAMPVYNTFSVRYNPGIAAANLAGRKISALI